KPVAACVPEVQREAVSTVARPHGTMHVGVIVAVKGMRIEQRLVAIGAPVAVDVADTRELGFLTRDDDEALIVLDHDAQAIEESLRKQMPLVLDEPPYARRARRDDDGVVLAHVEPARLEQLIAPVRSEDRRVGYTSHSRR